MAERYLHISPNILEYLDEEEMDSVRAVFAYILMANTDLDRDIIYSLVFKEGENIIWH